MCRNQEQLDSSAASETLLEAMVPFGGDTNEVVVQQCFETSQMNNYAEEFTADRLLNDGYKCPHCSASETENTFHHQKEDVISVLDVVEGSSASTSSSSSPKSDSSVEIPTTSKTTLLASSTSPISIKAIKDKGRKDEHQSATEITTERIEKLEQEEKRKQKKCVRFADDCGLSLSEHKMFSKGSSRSSGFFGNIETRLELALRLVMEKKKRQQLEKTPVPSSFWFLGFPQPNIAIGPISFCALLRKQKIALHRVLIVPATSPTAHDRLFGIIMTETIFAAEDKNHRLRRVFIRFTTDQWQSWSELSAERLSPDRFQFVLELPRVTKGSNNSKMSVEFCVGMQLENNNKPSSEEKSGISSSKKEKKNRYTYHWDDNGGLNYTLFAIAKSR